MASLARYCTIACLSAALAACSSAPSEAPPSDAWSQAEYEAELARLSNAIDEAIGGARAEGLAQCRALAVGAKPCGGPWEYRAFSMTDGDPARVLELTAAYNARNAEMNGRFGLASTCDMLLEPPLALDGGRCVLGVP